MKTKWKISILTLLLIFYAFAFFHFSLKDDEHLPKNTVMDVSRLMPMKVKKVVKGKEVDELIDIMKEANKTGQKISIAGKRHSQGGHTFYKDAVVLDMQTHNKILKVDPSKKTVLVESGATWDDVQKAVNPYGLSVKVMQSQNIFTIGGSLSVNAHGRDIRYGSLIDTVNYFDLLTSEGKIIRVSREQNAEYFPLVLGGYGLFGVILDAELQLTEDELYTYRISAMDYNEYPTFFKEHVLEQPDVRMHLARISTAPGDGFLKDMYSEDYVLANQQSKLGDYQALKGEEGTFITKFMLGLSRDFDWGKKLFWESQKKYFSTIDGDYVSRNNAMRSESKFLEYEDSDDTDILQEYFIPVDEFTLFIDDLKKSLKGEDLDLMNITIRYTHQNQDAVLSYAKNDMFALVLLINQKKSESGKKETGRIIRKMIDVVLKHNGSYYLPYYSYPTKSQMKEAYPRTEEFFMKKRELDPKERFMNEFYEVYGK
ncbi:FAD-binding oxidoreductase [Falsibacillus pallidus]|uniref:FAD/FMN-containing dehydrogenase n=1 Tax=Falsibacillus pallidus TaxID=493781 RepID=A0A370GRQ2_9BACI|nr:FAD-binding oxidoreductase [Falsibacillus pallidus]RDI45926.1 FAD/FMN-containing dehydrogenase [Falsibacillus pallidus]